MAVLVLISGENNSGKSVYAEQLITQTKGRRYYIATMLPCTEDNNRRIEKHRIRRQGLGFETLECPYQVGDASVSADSVVLLEDITNLLANAVFEKDKNVDDVFNDICALAERCRLLVAVTVSGLKTDGYDEETSAYIDKLNEINQQLFDEAAVALTMDNKIPMYQKGDIHDLN